MNDVFVSFMAMIGILIPSILLHIRAINKKDNELKKYKKENDDYRIKADVLDQILEFRAFGKIKNGVDEIFKTTIADRFLLLIAVNGKTHFNVVSVVFEQHKRSINGISAIARYKSLKIDDDYRDMLEHSESKGTLLLETTTMPKGLLKDIYEIEGVTHSQIRFIAREKIDKDNDVVIYSSLSTHVRKPFTKLEITKANIIYDSIITKTITDVIKKNNEIADLR